MISQIHLLDTLHEGKLIYHDFESATSFYGGSGKE
jgi:hypothetical protein